MCILKKMVPLLLAVALLAGCGQTTGSLDVGDTAGDKEIFVETVDVEDLEDLDIEDEVVALASGPAALHNLLVPEASGRKVEKNQKARIDYSNTKDGYVMVNFTTTTKTRLKVIIQGPTTKYTYDLPAKEWTTFPLSDGNGTYTVGVYEQNTKNTKYATVLSLKISVQLTDEFAPFLRPNQYVDYEDAVDTIAMAEKLVGKEKDPMKKVQKIYDYVVKNFKYDTKKASTVASTYLPELDKVLKAKKGICFDYAALMTGMLRSQGVPCKLVVGYAGSVYHAWINVWSEKSGWVNSAIYFNGTSWQRMDPTFASTGKSSKSIMKYIGDGSNYDAQRLY